MDLGRVVVVVVAEGEGHMFIARVVQIQGSSSFLIPWETIPR